MKKRYWIREDGRTNVSFGNNGMDEKIWTEITYEEYRAAADKILRKWAKMNGMG